MEDAGNALDLGYMILFEESGVTLSVHSSNAQDPLAKEAVILGDIRRRKISDVDYRAVMDALRGGEINIPLAVGQAEEPCDAAAVVTVSADEMFAYVRLLPPVRGGDPITLEALRRALDEAKVQTGVNAAALDALAKTGGYDPVCVAQGTPPKNGLDGTLAFGFRKEVSGLHKAGEDGKVNFRELDTFESVKKDQTLVTRTPATKGVDGVTVRGKTILGKNGKDIVLPRGKNVAFSEDGLVMRAAMDGRVDFTGGRVEVSSCYEIRGDADMSVGNLDFNGDIRVSGNVISGITLKASGNIEVSGIVEAAKLIAGNSILLKQGIQGMDKGELLAKNNIIVKFIERAKAQAGNTVTADTIIHSQVEANTAIIATGKRGSIMGGSARAGQYIVARTLGSPSHTFTAFEVGITPSQRQRILDLTQELKQLEGDMPKLDILMKSFQNPPQGTESPERAQMRTKVFRSKAQLLHDIQTRTEELGKLKQASSSATAGKVHALSVAYPNIRIQIGFVLLNLESEAQYATFKHKEGEINIGTLEYAQ